MEVFKTDLFKNDVFKNKVLTINVSVMFVVSLAFAYVSANLMVASGMETANVAYDWGFIIGRALTGVLLPLFLVVVSVSMFRHRKPIFSKGTYSYLWGMFLLVSVMAMLGSTAGPANV